MTAFAQDLSGRLEAWREDTDTSSLPGTPDAVSLLELVENRLSQEGIGGVEPGIWELYLERTRLPRFLCALPDAETRSRWAETTFRITEDLGFDLGALLAQRAASYPDRVLFRDLAEKGSGRWTYQRILGRVRNIAALFWKEGPQPQLDPDCTPPVDGPRVAILCSNSLASACCDLACLTHDLFVTPLNIHFKAGDLAWIFDRLKITVAVCDHPDRLEMLIEVRDRVAVPFVIYTLHQETAPVAQDVRRLDERRGLLDPGEVDRILAARPRRTMREPTTIMFTSGSTGRPKGVVFNQFNLVTKRFARAAALPAVGDQEVMLCYLPLFHTFGRYLEMLGSIFWGGTYIFAGNPSAATLIAQFQEVRPTALISVPIRWVQIRDRVLELVQGPKSDLDPDEVFREVVGDRLAWGLSAAGYLDPAVFRFFHRHGVELCSGFGMTEGTGGLTMTPPHDYVADSVGVPLPGVKTRLADQDELQIAGVYIARYLPEEGTPGDLKVDDPDSDEFWLSTGDLFRKTREGHLEIVDRIKDIYKNNRGQTIAPRQIESLFDQVPGFKHTFLAGDGRSYNTLLIVPDDQDDVLLKLTDEESRQEYFQRIVTTANPRLASFERILNFALLDRDFSTEKGELTSKGSYRRKIIEQNFSEVIAGLYQSSEQVLAMTGCEVRLPRWFHRDLGVLDDAILATKTGLINRETGHTLRVERLEEDLTRIGDLVYRVDGNRVDLGLMSRQPLLWLANPQFMGFAPCRTGWDTELGPYSEQVQLPADPRRLDPEEIDSVQVDSQLETINQLCCRALFGSEADALRAIVDLDNTLGEVTVREGQVIRRRLEALANHEKKSVRCRAYQVLVLDQPVPDYLQYLPAFIDSGKTFLDEQSFEAIGSAAIEPRRLLAFRQRLHTYRDQLTWPAPAKTRRLFEDLFRLLTDFCRFHPEFYGSIREELVNWALHHEDPELSRKAEQEFHRLAAWFEKKLQAGYVGLEPKAWTGKIVFQDGLDEPEVERLREVLIGTTFLKESILLAFEGEDLSLQEIGPGGIWVSRIISRYRDSRYRVSINTRTGKHFDLQVIIREDLADGLDIETIFWYIALRGHPFGTPMMPHFGCCRPELGALSMAYTSDLTVWEKIREFSSVRGPGTTPPTRMRWHQLLVRAMTVVVRGWLNSGRRIIPGLITPNNIVVPEPDFRRGAVQNTLSGRKPYTGPLSLIRPLWRNIYQHTISHYPWTEDYLEREWILEAFVEALGIEDALEWFEELRVEMSAMGNDVMGLGFQEALAGFVDSLRKEFYQPLNLKGAIHRFREWEILNTQAPLKARLEILEELSRLYRLDRLPAPTRFYLFRHTYFLNADIQLLDIFDRLLVRMFRHPDRRPTQMVELSDFQDALTDPDDRVAFNRLAFPHRLRTEEVALEAVGDPGRDQVRVRSTIVDRHGQRYFVGEPSGPAEVGQLYRLFLRAGFPKNISQADNYFVTTNEAEQIVGGMVFRELDETAVFLDGIVVTQALTERGIAPAMLADFCTRMTSRGYKTVKTHFFLRRFYEKHGFRVDQRWGGLVRFL